MAKVSAPIQTSTPNLQPRATSSSVGQKLKRMFCLPSQHNAVDHFAGLPQAAGASRTGASPSANLSSQPAHLAPQASAMRSGAMTPTSSIFEPLEKAFTSMTRMAPVWFSDNIITLTDSYKVSHFKQYPPQTEVIYSYMEGRVGGRFDGTVFFGLQYYLKRYLADVRITKEMVESSALVMAGHFPEDASCFNYEGWMHIVEAHGGRLPVRICAIPEGTYVPSGNVMLTVENTDPKCFWLTNYLETMLTHVWYASTVATQSREMKKTIKHYLEETGGDVSTLELRLHDFGFRGVSSVESAAVGGAAHLINFKGTDTLPAIMLLGQFYQAGIAGFSIPAAEHSTITSWGREKELQAYANMLKAYPKGPVAVVSDSYDVYRACSEMWGEALHDEITGRDGVLVVRPDSGEPKDIVLRIHEILGEKFGTEINAKGFKQLPPKIAVVQGDGIDVDSVDVILSHLKAHNWATSGLSLGSGGGLLQKLNRDTQKVVFKASAALIDGTLIDVYKDPITDKGKLSKKGKLKLVIEDGEYKTVNRDAPGDNMLREVFLDGKLLIDESLETIRARAAV